MPILNWRELQYENSKRQLGGNEIDAENNPWLDGWDPNAKNATQDYFNRLETSMFGANDLDSRRKDIATGIEDVPSEMAARAEAGMELGYGEDRRRDLRVPVEDWVEDPVNFRANSQTQVSKLKNGFVKMIPYAVSTFVDNTVGLVNGVLGIGVDAVDGGKFTPGRDFIDTFTANLMQDWREGVDERYPNYRTQEEIDDAEQWWKHLNGNFWGDTFLKNLGFTIGAGASGYVFSRGINALQKGVVNKAYKAALAAASGDAEATAALENGFKEILNGGSISGVGKMYDSLEKIRKSYQRLNWESQLIGGMGSAVGESRTEALNAAREFRKDYEQRAKAEMESRIDALSRVIISNPDYVVAVNGEPFLTQAGNDYYTAEIKKIRDSYADTMKQVDNEAAALANKTFWMNMPLLTGTNIIMFGRMMSGGFKSQSKIKVRGNIDSGYRLAGGVGRGLLNVAKTSASEGMEELSQKIFSEGAKDIAEHNMAAFHDGKYDIDAIKGLSQNILSLMDSAGHVIGDPTSWEEFAVGAITGGLSSFVMGGFREGLGGTAEERAKNKEVVDTLNERLKDPDFKAMWEGLVRHNHYEDLKNVALNMRNDKGEVVEHNTKYAWRTPKGLWHTMDDAQVISDITMFAKIGKLNDLEDMVDSFANLTIDDIPDIRTKISDNTDPEFNSKSDAQLLLWIHERANNVKEAIEQYRNIRDSIDYLSLGTTEDEVIDEIVYTRSQLNNFEKRYQAILDSVMDRIRPSLEHYATETTSDGKLTQRGEWASRLLASREDFSKIFGGVNIDLAGRMNDNPVVMIMNDAAHQDTIDKLESIGAFTNDKELLDDVKDLQDLVKNRAEFYSKLYFPQNRKSFADSFHEQAKKPEDVADGLNEEAVNKKVASIIEELSKADSLSSYIELSNRLLGVGAIDNETFAAIGEKLQEAIDSNEKLHGFDSRITEAQEFISQLNEVNQRMIDDNEDEDIGIDLDFVKSLITGDGKAQELLSDIAEGQDDIVWAARKLLELVGNRKRPEQILRMMMEEVLKDKAQANGLGTIKPEENPEGNEGGEKSKFEELSEALDLVNKLHDPLLEKLIAGDFSEYEELTEEEKTQLMAKAKTVEHDLKKRLGMISDDDSEEDSSKQNKAKQESEDDPAVQRRKKENHRKVVSTISGTRTSVYVPGPSEVDEGDETRTLSWGLRQGVKKLFTYKNDKKQAIANWLVAHKVQDFIDSGALMKLYKEYAKRGKRLPIYFIANPHYVEDNFANNPFVERIKKKGRYGDVGAPAPSVLLAIEMSAENRSILSAFEGDVIDDNALITVNDNGNAVQYQVIGEAWNPSPDEISRIREKEGPEAAAEYSNVKDHYQKIWEHAVYDSIIPQYKEDIKKNSAVFGPEGRWYVARQNAELGSVEDNGEPVFVPGYSTEIETSYTTRSGKDITGKYTVSVDDDGFVKVKSAVGKTRRSISFEESGLTIDEILGRRDEFGDPSYYDKAAKEIQEEGLQFGDIVIRPDGTVELNYTNITTMGSSVPIVDENKARDVVAKVFPELIPAINERYAGNKEKTIGDRYFTTLNYVMTGRNETRAFGDPEYHKIPLRESLTRYKKFGGEYYFAMPTKESIVMSPQQGARISLPSSINAPLGSLWMATRTANGDFSWTYITIARTGNYEFDEESNANTALMKRFNNIVERLFKPSSKSANYNERVADAAERRKACSELSDMFYFGPQNMVTFNYTDEGVSVNIGGESCSNRDELIETIKSMNVRFQVSSDAVSDGGQAIEELIDAGVLTSEMRSFIRLGATIGVNFMEDRDSDNQEVPLHVVEQKGQPVAFNPGDEAGTIVSTPRPGVFNVRIGDAGYMIDENGKVRRMTSRNADGGEVLDANLIAEVKAMAQAIELKQTMKMSPSSRIKVPSNVNMRIIERKIDTSHTEVDKNGKKVTIPGSRTVEYAELYLVSINDTLVPIISHNREANDLTIVRDLGYWNEIWNYSLQFKQNRFNTVEEKPAELTDDELYQKFAEEQAEQEGGEARQKSKPVEKPTQKKGPKRGGGFDVELKSERSRRKTTTSEQRQKESEEEDTNNCGRF